VLDARPYLNAGLAAHHLQTLDMAVDREQILSD
jgi:hypothetical protein